ncbi:glycoside hydrolase family 15 protein [Plasticicumulans sp.]|uniref:glycoside hydrolase family 15 protein n=1 Tax=Plasticicumulans sp. TaxID=2307179 RepID=UPI002CF65439|nr:glycoside hydrolase family 15 protein [Plasticicumulans sp.]HMW29168.1 glycoside hydrolase family 15 protein [Plasticicumulans sp.]HND98196.1 glycoside hydrolase family 15 protein [Plasticicumulans sp.]HNF65355.1 glycoside hydrolase family 15 protein [Plasticicumulans sp.]HNG48532.1 glycoside hydrolase family 15 protein [Plasticicumulans sp.]HNI22194.1 glycoside hydrolase family 15 protein [Plasticicumulans sp.]
MNPSARTPDAVRLGELCAQIETVMLARQDPVTGLLPASTAVTVHGDYTDAWVRDNVYSILCVWGCGLALRRHRGGDPRAYRFEQGAVKTMRGLLTAMMKQAHKVERFKHTLAPIDALHAKYGSRTGEPVVADDGWGHLQIDATSVFLLMLVQMIASGLRVVYSLDEVDFVQALAHYIARAYRTPDYGIWERGDKINTGDPEINASSVGMAKAALEALRGFDLFGAEGGPASVIHVSSDDIARMRNLLEATLPRESRSKEVDAALLSVIGFPAWAVEDAELVERTRHEVVAKLQGRYGCKRFLRDGHQTVLEDHTRLHYESGELARFERIESEWPLFFTYLMLDGLMRGRDGQAHEYRERLAPLLVDRGAGPLLPELYLVPEKSVAAEKARPGSQPRLPNANVPLYWAQSLYWLALLIDEGWLHPGDIDPLNRRHRIGRRRECTVQVALIADTAAVETALLDAGVRAQTPEAVLPVRVRQASELVEAMTNVGRNAALGLSGRPRRGVGTLVTCQVFTIGGETVVFLPQFLERQDFYLNLSNRVLISRCKAEFAHVRRHWDQAGQPVFALRLTARMLATDGAGELLDFLRALCAGSCEGLPVRVRPLSELIATAGRKRFDRLRDYHFEFAPLEQERSAGNLLDIDPAAARELDAADLQRLEDLPPPAVPVRLAATRNLHEVIALLEIAARRDGIDAPLPDGRSVRACLEAAYALAAEAGHWGLLRRCAGLLDKHDPKLEDAVANIVAHRKQIALGRGYSDGSVVSTALGNREIVACLRQYAGDDPAGRMLVQEVVLAVETLLKTDPAVFRDTMTIRAWPLVLLVVGDYAWEHRLSQPEAFRRVQTLGPWAFMGRVQAVVRGDNPVSRLARLESLRRDDAAHGLAVPDPQEDAGAEAVVDWLAWRRRHGVLTQLSAHFYEQVWAVLAHCEGLVLGERLDIGNCLDSARLRADMTAAETNFALTVNRLLDKIQSPEYRQLNIEALAALAHLCSANPGLHVAGHIVIDVLTGHAVRLHWLQQHPDHAGHYEAFRAEAWSALYASPPAEVESALIGAFAHLLGEARPAAA